jgi:VWFA-related protein
VNPKTLSALATLVLVAAIYGLYFAHAILGTGPVTISIQASALLLMVWARLTFGLRSFHFTANPTEGELITSGPFRYVRNPIYAAVLLFIWTGVATNLTVVSAALGLLVLAMLLVRIFCEEGELRAHYPEYGAYARHTKRLVPFIFLLVCMPVVARSETTLRSQTRVVQINVVVKDSKGRVVGDLSKEDFTLTDAHKPRAIQMFSVEQGGEVGQGPLPIPTAPNIFSNRAPAVAEAGRVIAIVLDGNNTTFDDFASARLRIMDLVGKLKPGDRIAIYVLHLGLRILQDYTADRERLLKSITAYSPPALRPRAPITQKSPRSNTAGMSKVEDVSDELTADMNPEETSFRVRMRAEDTIAAFRAISDHMAILPGRKSVIWLSGGFSWRQLAGSSGPSFDAAAAAMNDSNVALYAVDARPLAYSTETNIATLKRFADATGGKAYYHRNDIDQAILEAIEDSQVSYTLGFYLADDERDGKFHPLKVSVDRRGLELRYRRGYFAGIESSSGSLKKNKPLEAELLNPLDSTAVGIDARVEIVADGSGKKILVGLAVDPQSVTLKRSGDEWTGKIERMFVERAEDGTVLAKISDSTQFQVTEKTRARYEAGEAVFPSSVRLVDGAVKLHIVVRDAESGRTGSLTVPLHY